MNTQKQLEQISAQRAAAVVSLNAQFEALPMFKKAAMTTTAEGKIIAAALEAIKALSAENAAFLDWIKEGAI